MADEELWFYKREDLPIKRYKHLLLFKKPAKRKTKGKVKRKETPMVKVGKAYVHCAVPECRVAVFCGWRDESSGKGLNTCQEHLHKHSDKSDPFNFYSLLEIPVPQPKRKDRDTMAKKKKTSKKVDGVGSRIAAIFSKKGVRVNTRGIEVLLNKGKKPDQQTSIHAIRAATKGMIKAKELVVVEVVGKQFVLAKFGTPKTKVAKAAKKKVAKKKVAKKKKAKK